MDTDIKQILLSRLADLDTEDTAGEGGQKTVMLDQQAVGRLSRMDALQNQAMARATACRRQVERQKITAALLRIETDEYGYCTACGDAIAPARLDADPAMALCLTCMRGG